MYKLTPVTEEDKKLYPCMWCGDMYSEHRYREKDRLRAKTPCLSLKFGYYPRRPNKQEAVKPQPTVKKENWENEIDRYQKKLIRYGLGTVHCDYALIAAARKNLTLSFREALAAQREEILGEVENWVKNYKGNTQVDGTEMYDGQTVVLKKLNTFLNSLRNSKICNREQYARVDIKL